jgi:phosphatidylglycerophosphate synthase
MMLFAFACSQALELHVLPQLSMNGIYAVFIGCYLVTLPFLRWIPPHPVTKSPEVAIGAAEAGGMHHVGQRHVPPNVPWLVLAAIVVTYISLGAYWTYIELASQAEGATPAWVGKVLAGASFCSIVGCLFATVVGMLAGGISDLNIVISIFSFNFLWIFVDVYQMATVANIDHSGRFAALMPSAQGLGQILGPNLAATILAAGYGYPGVFVMCSIATLCAMLIYAAMYLRLRQAIPALADASWQPVSG